MKKIILTGCMLAAIYGTAPAQVSKSEFTLSVNGVANEFKNNSPKTVPPVLSRAMALMDQQVKYNKDVIVTLKAQYTSDSADFAKQTAANAAHSKIVAAQMKAEASKKQLTAANTALAAEQTSDSDVHEMSNFMANINQGLKDRIMSDLNNFAATMN